MVVNLDKIDVWHDPRVLKLSAEVNGKTYGASPRSALVLLFLTVALGYWDAGAQGIEKGVIFLVHGFPDLAAGWRYQIPMFVNMGIRVIAIDCVGYGRTDSPDPSMEPYTVKSTASDIVTLAEQLGYKKIILGGHDWYVPFEMPTVRRSFEPSDDTYARGGLIVQRTAQYHPSTVTHVFSICTPYFPIMQTYYPINLLIKAFPSYQYMLQFSKGLIEPQVRSRNEIREFLNSVHGFPQGPDGEKGFTPSTGFIVENFPKLACSELFTEGELDFYVQEYARHGVNGPFKWYRTRELNFVDDFAEFISPKDSSEKLREDPGIEQEVLHVLTLRDEVFPRHVCEATEKGFKKLTKATMDADHWVLWSEPKELNEILEKWILEKVL